MEDNNEVEIVYKDSWHYPLVEQHFKRRSWKMPKTECHYYRILLFSILTYPIWRPFTKVLEHHGLYSNIGGSLLLWSGLFLILGSILGGVDLFILGSEFNDDNVLHMLFMTFSLIVTIGITIVLSLFIKDLWDDWKFDIRMKKKEVETEELKDNENEFSFLTSLMKWKRKICKPIEYRER